MELKRFITLSYSGLEAISLLESFSQPLPLTSSTPWRVPGSLFQPWVRIQVSPLVRRGPPPPKSDPKRVEDLSFKSKGGTIFPLLVPLPWIRLRGSVVSMTGEELDEGVLKGLSVSAGGALRP
jgi:hypothetical protein